MTYWAHSDRRGLMEDEPGAAWQPLARHLENVGSLARRLAREAAPRDKNFQDLAAWAGLLHDFGKYTAAFQKRIRGQQIRAPHADFGASLAKSMGLESVALAVAGHHAGLPNQGQIFLNRLKDKLAGAHELIAIAAGDSGDLRAFLSRKPGPVSVERHRFDLLVRMLFSVLIDADRLDTAAYAVRPPVLGAAEKLRLLLDHIMGLSKAELSEQVLRARQLVLEDCLRAAECDDRLLALSVPTGGGKTLAAMALALRRAALRPDEYRRIIVVIPYLSIIEQNAAIYRGIFGASAVLEHHSGVPARLRRVDKGDVFEPPREDEGSYTPPYDRPDTENWETPVIVTTSLRFFESLFSNHPSDARRVHNIARSIVILDEVQVVPSRLLSPLLGMIRELADDWGCTFVFSTATQPGFEVGERAGAARGVRRPDPRWPEGTVREVITDTGWLYKSLLRVRIQWKLDQPVDWPEVADWMAAEDQALCIVNLREHARILYEEVCGRSGAGAVFHLSTRMCAAHRLARLAQIKKRLHRGEACRVISTQLVEAGVDIDFPVVFRAMAPLDAIIQAAGRADRNGHATAAAGHPAGRVIVFRPTDDRVPKGYGSAVGITNALAQIRDVQCDDLVSLQDFYSRLYGDEELGHELTEERNRFQFAALSDEFEWISDRTLDVFVPYGEGSHHVDELMAIGALTHDLRVKLQRFTVGLRPSEFQKAQEGALVRVRKDQDLWVSASPNYSDELGFQVDGSRHANLIF